MAGIDIVINYIDWFLLIFLLLLSIRFDLKKGIIPNKLLVIFLLIKLLILIAAYVFSLISFFEILNLFIDFLLVLVVSYFIWNMRLWSGGDAKLVSVISLLIPRHVYHYEYIPNFPGFSLIANIFIVSFVLLLIYYIYILISRKKFFLALNSYFVDLSESLKKLRVRKIGYNLFLIFQLALIGFFFSLPLWLLVLLIFLIFPLYFSLIKKYNKQYKKIETAFALIVVLELLFLFEYFNLDFVYSLILLVLIRVVYYFINGLCKNLNKMVAGQKAQSELREGDIIIYNESLPKSSGIFNKKISADDLKKIKKIDTKGSAKYLVENEFPFIFYIILGIIITIILNGRIILNLNN